MTPDNVKLCRNIAEAEEWTDIIETGSYFAETYSIMLKEQPCAIKEHSKNVKD